MTLLHIVASGEGRKLYADVGGAVTLIAADTSYRWHHEVFHDAHAPVNTSRLRHAERRRLMRELARRP
ncbi:hypothetical protein KCP70_22435 [Salmonella enterica subsp. enterica]|nr:hypothetical protein KCP70_22435 [Salmonella enterica subsp. enterica]